MTKEEFIKAHTAICTARKGRMGRCGRRLYDYLIREKLPLDIYFNRKQKEREREEMEKLAQETIEPE